MVVAVSDPHTQDEEAAALAQYAAAHTGVVIFDHSHAPTLLMRGADTFALLQRLSTNDVASLAVDEACPTLFLNATGRILERVIVQREGDDARLFLEPGRDTLLLPYLRRNIFFRDDVTVAWETDRSRFEIIGPLAMKTLSSLDLVTHGASAIRTDNDREDGWLINCRAVAGSALWRAIQVSSPAILKGSESIREFLRIESGLPAADRELTPVYLPLELGLWDEVSFEKGCYIGQEIIARMESRQQLARLLVCLELDDSAVPDMILLRDGKRVGKITSIARGPCGDWRGLGVVRRGSAVPETELIVRETQACARVRAVAGRQPAWATA